MCACVCACVSVRVSCLCVFTYEKDVFTLLFFGYFAYLFHACVVYLTGIRILNLAVLPSLNKVLLLLLSLLF